MVYFLLHWSTLSSVSKTTSKAETIVVANVLPLIYLAIKVKQFYETMHYFDKNSARTIYSFAFNNTQLFAKQLC